MKKKQFVATILLAMRITIVQITLAFIFTSSLYATKTSGQEILDKKISISVENLELSKVLLKVQNLTGVKFLYSSNTILADRKISFSVIDKKLGVFINEIIRPLSIDYKVVEDQILLFPSNDNAQADMNSSSGQDIPRMQAITLFFNDNIVTGTVTDNNGAPLIGATVMVKSNKSIVTTTDNSGAFKLDIGTPGAVLVISYTGFKSQEISVAANQVVSVRLAIAENSLDAIIVTGYSRQSKRDVTGAISTISADVVAKTPVTDVGSILQGRAAGVSVDAQGDPGSTAVVRIRGFGTNGDNDPLYVIDGVQMRGGNNLINPGDIETITILKDPSITSLYGAEGGNGVIVITTKTGKQGAPRLEYSSYASWENPIKYPGMLTPQQYADTYWGYLANSGLALNDQYYGSGSKPVLPDFIIERQSGAQLVVPAGDPAADLSLYNLSTYRILQTNKNGTDWWRTVLGSAFSQSHQLSLSGATDKSNYALSLNFLDNNGVSVGTYFRRYSIRVNSEFKPARWLKIGENIQFSYSQGSGVSGGNHNPQGYFADLYQHSPLIPIYDIAGNYSGPNGIVNSLSFHPGGNNPLLGLVDVKKNGGGFNSGVIGSSYIDIEPVKGLVFETKIGIQFYPYSYRYFYDTIPQNVFNAPYNSFTEGGGWSSDWRWTSKVSYDVRIKQIHKISAFAAYESRQYVSRSNSGTTPNLPYTTAAYLNLSNGAPVLNGGPYNTVSGYNDGATSVSIFGNVNYSLLDKYLFSYVIRRDGSSKFGPLRKYGVFPSYSVGWRVSKEKLLDNISWIDDLKLRGAIGSNGNDAIPSGLYENQYNTDTYVSSYDLGGLNNAAATGVGLYQIGNPFIHWETNKTTNIGFDALLFHNHLNISFSWFDRQTKDLLGVPPVTGLQGDALAPYENILRFSNKGVELELGYNNDIGRLRYEINFNISNYRNKVEYIDQDSVAHLDGDSYAPTHFALTRSIVGRPVSSFFGLVQEGIFQSGEEYTKENITYPGLTAANAAGHFKFKDINNDGKIDDDDRTFIGTPHPKFAYGLNVNLYYKNFDVAVFLQGVYGNDIFNYWRASSVWPGALGAGSEDTWSTANTNAKLPIWNSNLSVDKNPSSFFVEDGSYLRIKSLQLGYTFPKSKAFSKLRLYVQGYNLATFTKYTGIDPEISTGSPTNAGVDFGGNYPIARKILVGVNFGL